MASTTPDRDRDPKAANRDPKAADRRTLTIAMVVVMVFVAIGVTSAALFTTSACERIGPEAAPLPPVVTVDDIPAVAAAVDTWSPQLGSFRGAWDLGSADGVDEPVELVLLGDGRAAVRDGTVVVVDLDDGPVAASRFAPPANVVGDGAHQFSLAWMNELTGQVDALTSIDDALVAGGCLDTAVVGSPLAFHLDAGGGELLLLRVEEDGDDPVLELRHPSDGPRWRAELDVPVQPPGILAERTSAGLGEQVAVAGRRFRPGDTNVIAAYSRTDGTAVWQLAAGDLPIEGGDTWSVEVHDIASSFALIGLEDDTATRRLVALSSSDGSTVWSFDVAGPYQVVRSGWLIAVVVSGEHPAVIVVDGSVDQPSDPPTWPGATAAFPVDGQLLLSGDRRDRLLGAEQTVTLPATPIVGATGDEFATFVVVADGDRHVLVVFAAA